MDYTSFRTWFDTQLEQYLQERMRVYKKISSHEETQVILEHVHELAHGGKRIRPYMMWLGYRLAGGEDPMAIKEMLIGAEIFHLFCLIHDDVIDKGDLRHGVKTIHEYTNDRMVERDCRGDLKHLANGQAILVGDLTFAWAQECFWQGTPKGAPSVLQEVRVMIDEVVIGQMIDVDLMVCDTASEEVIQEKMRLKTAGYTFTRPMRIGYALSGKIDIPEFIETFGSSLGVAFQIQDDLLDILGDETMSKTVLSDMQDGQHTYFSSYIFTHGTERDRLFFQQHFGRRLSDSEKGEIKKLLLSSGSIEAGKQEVQACLDKASTILREAVLDEEVRSALFGILEKIRSRKS